MQDNRILHQRFTAQHRQGRQGGLQSRLRLLRQVCLCHAVGTALRVFVIQKKRSDQIDVVDFPALRCKADDPGKHRGYSKANRAIGGGDMRFDRLTASLPQQQTAEKGLVGAIALQHMERTIHFPEPNRFKQIGKAVKCL